MIRVAAFRVTARFMQVCRRVGPQRWVRGLCLLAWLLLGGVAALPLAAQTTQDTRSTREAYGARLTPVGPDDVPTIDRRAVKRVETRVNSRIATRIERYRVGSTADPGAAFKQPLDDGTRRIPTIQPVPQAAQEDDPG
jgi:hypothetical protein